MANNLLLKISATPSYPPVPSEVPPQESKGTFPLCIALKRIWEGEATDNYSDIKLATKDGVSLAAHKFILAARSPFFHSLIKAETKKEGFSGTIKLPDMNAQPMRVILKWIYTDELEGLEGCFPEVLEGAAQFQLTDLLEALDKKVITFCNFVNMTRIYGIVLPMRNEMPNAYADISEMIKEYFLLQLPPTRMKKEGWRVMVVLNSRQILRSHPGSC